MKTTCFMILFLLVSVLVNASSADIQAADSGFPSAIVEGFQRFLAKAHGFWATAKNGAANSGSQPSDTNSIKVQVASKKGKHGKKANATQEHRGKKRKVHHGISKKHPPPCVVHHC